jgi:predicted ester cyclase
MTRSALELARALYGAYNAHAADDAAALYSPSATHTEISRGQQTTGREDIGRGLARFFEFFPDAHWEALHEIADGPNAAIPYRLTGTLQAPMGPIAPAGQRLDLRGVHVIHVGEEGILATEDYWDGATFQSQMRPPDGS